MVIGSRILLPLLICLCGLPSASAENSGYIFEIPAERSADSQGPLGDYIQVTLDYANPEKAAALIQAHGAVDILQVTDRQIIIGVTVDATATRTFAEKDLAASFVVDFDEEAVASTARLLRDSYGEHPSADEIEQFVFEFIDDKNYRGSFDLASKVAATRSGDCTEHAVLLAALARAHGLPARLAFGVLLLNEDNGIQGYGHAWTEVYVEDNWQLLDGTVPVVAADKQEAFYLPLMALNDEGPGYGLDFMRLVNVQPARISNIRGVTP